MFKNVKLASTPGTVRLKRSTNQKLRSDEETVIKFLSLFFLFFVFVLGYQVRRSLWIQKPLLIWMDTRSGCEQGCLNAYNSQQTLQPNRSGLTDWHGTQMSEEHLLKDRFKHVTIRHGWTVSQNSSIVKFCKCDAMSLLTNQLSSSTSSNHFSRDSTELYILCTSLLLNCVNSAVCAYGFLSLVFILFPLVF